TSIGYTTPIDDTSLPGEDLYEYFRYYRPVWNPNDGVAGTVIVDNGDSGYSESGAWSSALDAYGFQDKETRCSTTMGSTASWTPALPGSSPAGYEISVWNPSFHQSATAATYEIKHEGGTNTVTLDLNTVG